MKNNGNSTFTVLPSVDFTGIFQGDISWGDYNNDGFQDLLLVSRTSTNVYVAKVYKNINGSSFSEQTSISLTGVAGSCAWIDYDNDGDLDINVSGYTGSVSVTKIYRNDKNNLFTELPLIALIGGKVAWGDYDKDGDLDLLICGYSQSTSYTSKIFRNNKNDTFTEQSAITIKGLHDGDCSWMDFDYDGILDFIVTGFDGTNDYTKIYKNNGNNTFTEQVSIVMPGIVYSSAIWGDYNNDGKADLFITGYDASVPVCKLYKNNFAATNNAPNIPSNKKTIVKGDTATLSWDRASDDHTFSKSITYNLYLWVNYDPENFIVSPLSKLSNGFREVTDMGNMQLDTFFVINNLSDGKYYWSVQAVDNSYLGSAFEKVDSFTIGCTALMPIANGTNICSSKSVTLNATGGINYRWYDDALGGTLLGSNASFTTSILSSTTSYYVANFDGICESVRKKVTVVVSTSSLSIEISPLLNAHYDCNSAPEKLIASPAGGTFSGTGVELGFFIPSMAKAGHINSIYYTFGDTSNGCNLKDSIHVYVYPCIGLTENSDIVLKTYPNPSDGVVTLKIETIFEEISIQIIDETGITVFTDRKSANGVYLCNVNLSDYPAGLYITKIIIRDAVLTSKFIIKH